MIPTVLASVCFIIQWIVPSFSGVCDNICAMLCIITGQGRITHKGEGAVNGTTLVTLRNYKYGMTSWNANSENLCVHSTLTPLLIQVTAVQVALCQHHCCSHFMASTTSKFLKIWHTIASNYSKVVQIHHVRLYYGCSRPAETTGDLYRPLETNSSDQQRPLETIGDKKRPAETAGDQ